MTQIPLVTLTDKERIELGRKAAQIATDIDEMRDAFAEVKEDHKKRLDVAVKTLHQTLHALRE